jgi:lipoprotein-anchoring transpeptidase ErfK/SrfK
VAIHASSVRRGSATHGCIGIPLAFAQLLFDQVARGDLVTIVGA